MTPATTLRREILKAAQDNGYTTQKEIAKALRLSPQYLNDILRRRGRRITPDIVTRAARRLKVGRPVENRWHLLGAAESGWKVGA